VEKKVSLFTSDGRVMRSLGFRENGVGEWRHLGQGRKESARKEGDHGGGAGREKKGQMGVILNLRWYRCCGAVSEERLFGLRTKGPD